jgi:hypothetical protein
MIRKDLLDDKSKKEDYTILKVIKFFLCVLTHCGIVRILRCLFTRIFLGVEKSIYKNRTSDIVFKIYKIYL